MMPTGMILKMSSEKLERLRMSGLQGSLLASPLLRWKTQEMLKMLSGNSMGLECVERGSRWR